MDNDVETGIDCHIKFFAGKNTFQNHDRRVDAGLAQCPRLAHAGNSKAVSIGKRLRHFEHAVTIGIGFDDGHQPGTRRPFANYLEIMLECAEPDDCPCPKSHGYASSA